MCMSPYHYDGYLDPTSVENRFGVTRLELAGVMLMVQGFCPLQCRSLWLVITPKSKDQFMERPPMKIVGGGV
jgi:hypothetical protein